LNRKKFFHSLLIFLCTFFLTFPLTNVAAKSDNNPKNNLLKKTELHNNKQTQIHLHLNQCSKDAYSHAYVKLNGEWKELTNQGKSPLFKLLDKGEYVSDDITEFKFISGTSEVVVPVTEMRVGVEANGTVNYWLPKCPKVEKPHKVTPTQLKTEISLDVKGTSKHYSKIYLKVKGEWKELTLHKKTSKFYLIIEGQLRFEDITEVKCITVDNKEIRLNVSKLKVEAKSTKKIELSLKQPPKSKATVRHTQIHLHLQKCPKDFSKVYVQLNGKWIELNQQGKSPLYKLLDQGLYVKDDITAFKLVTKTGAEAVVPISQLKVGVEAQGTINYWLLNCPKIDKSVDGGSNPPVKNEDMKPKPPKKHDLKPPVKYESKPQPPKNGETKSTLIKKPGSTAGNPGQKDTGESNGADQPKGTDQPKSADQPKGPDLSTTNNNSSESVPPSTGSLPQTGEASSAWYYIIGFILLVIGTILVGLKKGRK
jgi:LPXTG-motif cell wall-anchored protein